MSEPTWSTRLREIFLRAGELPDDAREAYLDEACAGDTRLRTEIESLLEHDTISDGFLETPASASFAQGVFGEERMPERIGHYRIIAKLGEGGAGIVFLAEQENPSRQVALKILRTGTLSGAMLRRFEHEASVLARLRHPGIAQIHEAGIHEEGHTHLPFLAMELIEGKTLTEHAETHALDARQRIELFRLVCDAVQHAHSRGIIHRDLKPGNILVDEEGQPKVLDFGVARATDADVALSAQRTTAGQIIGTLAYMSPEQIAAEHDDLDTRADVYALGVILYELLSGRLPHKVTTLADAARAIRDDQPRLLGSVAPALKGDLETIARKALEKDKERRYAGAAELSADLGRFLRNEPIMARDPSALYHICKFAARHRALVGGAALIVLALVVALIATSLALARSREAEAKMRAAASSVSEVNEFLVGMLEWAEPGIAQGREVTVREAVDAAAHQLDARAGMDPRVEAVVRTTIGETYTGLGKYEEAEAQLQRAIALADQAFDRSSPQRLEVLYRLADAQLKANSLEDAARSIEWLDASARESPQQLVRAKRMNANRLWLAGSIEESESAYREAIATAQGLLGPDDAETLLTRLNFAQVLRQTARLEEAHEILIAVTTDFDRTLGADHPLTLGALGDLAATEESMGKTSQAEASYREVIDRRTRVLGPDHPATLELRNNLALLLRYSGRLDEAEPMFRDILAHQRALLPPDHMNTISTMNNLALLLKDQGKLDETVALQREALAALERSVGDKHPNYLAMLNNIATTLRAEGRAEEAVQEYGRLVVLVREILGDAHPTTHAIMHNRAGAMFEAGRIGEALEAFERTVALAEQGGDSYPPTNLGMFVRSLGSTFTKLDRFEEAEVQLLRAERILSESSGPESPAAVNAREELVTTYERWGREADAERWRERLAAGDADDSEGEQSQSE